MSRARAHLLILRAGHTAPEVIRDHGDYDRWFTDRMESLGCRFTLQHVPDAGVPDTSGYDGVLVTGTAASVRDRAAWMEPLRRYLARDDESAPPVLAVCFGAQLAAEALGGRVERNPLGWEIGTVSVDRYGPGRDDPLFEGLSDRIVVQATHEDTIAALPPGATPLAGNAMSAVQAFSRGRRMRAVQFHPEASAAILRTLIRLRRAALEREGRERIGLGTEEARSRVDRIEASVRETGDGRRILENWVRRFVLERQKIQER